MLLKNVLKNSGNKEMQYAKLLNGEIPIFSQFGKSIYASDIVQICIDIIATECSKMQPRHIRTDSKGMQTNVKGSINRLFKFAPNHLMTTRDFIEKIIWLLYLNYNAFIYPTYEKVVDSRGNVTTNYTGFYPLNPMRVEFLQDKSGKLFVKMYFEGGENFTLAYSDLIHLRKKFSVSDVMGGGRNGQPDNQALLKVLETNDIVLQNLGKAVKTSLTVRGILRINNLLNDKKQEEERIRFEKRLEDGTSGLAALDFKGDYIPISVNPKIIDKVTMEFLQSKVLNWYGVSVPILTGDFNDEQYQAFYEKTLESLMISLGQAFSKTLFTARELDVGNEIVFYQKNMMYLSTKSKIELLKTAGEQGLLTDNQKLAVIGYPPIEGGDRRTISLNYVNKEIADQYQLNRARWEGKPNGQKTTAS